MPRESPLTMLTTLPAASSGIPQAAGIIRRKMIRDKWVIETVTYTFRLMNYS